MTRPAKRFRRLVVAILLGPPLIWGLILALLPMDWARDKIVARLRADTGQEVRLGKVRLRALGGVRIYDLEFAAEGSTAGPWLKVGALTVDVSARDLVVGAIAPTNAHLSGVKLRIHRDAAGLLEFEGLFRKVARAPTSTGPDPRSDAPTDGAAEMTYQVEDASVSVVDDSTDTRLEFTEVRGHGQYDGVLATLDEMTGRLNGGSIRIAAKLDTKGGRTALEGEVHAEGVALGVGMKSLAYAIPLLAQAADGTSAQGDLTLDLLVKSDGPSSDAIARNLRGSGSLDLEGLTLDHSRVMAEVTKHLPVPTRDKLGSLRGSFEIAKGRVSTDDTVLRVADLPVNLSGWSDFDGRLDYLVRGEGLGRKVQTLAERLPPEARELLDELPVEKLDGLVNLEVTGTIDRPIVRPKEGGLFSKKHNPIGDPARRAEERAKLKQAGKKFLDRVIR